MNKVILIGRAATPPEYGQTKNGVSRAVFRLAVQRRYKNEQGKYDADFFTVVCWRGAADLVRQYLAKGDRCGVVGSIQLRPWQDEGGNKRVATEIIADEVDFMGGRQREEAEEPERPAYQPQSYTQQSAFVQVDDDELPF